jgi:ArsR family transcriptional regulator
MTSRVEAAQAVRVAKALGDPMRYRIYAAVAGAEELSCAVLVERFPIGQPTVSHHLKVLSGAGLLSVRKSGAFHLYRARRDVLEGYLRHLGGVLRVPAAKEPVA